MVFWTNASHEWIYAITVSILRLPTHPIKTNHKAKERIEKNFLHCQTNDSNPKSRCTAVIRKVYSKNKMLSTYIHIAYYVFPCYSLRPWLYLKNDVNDRIN